MKKENTHVDASYDYYRPRIITRLRDKGEIARVEFTHRDERAVLDELVREGVIAEHGAPAGGRAYTLAGNSREHRQESSLASAAGPVCRQFWIAVYCVAQTEYLVDGVRNDDELGIVADLDVGMLFMEPGRGYCVRGDFTEFLDLARAVSSGGVWLCPLGDCLRTWVMRRATGEDLAKIEQGVGEIDGVESTSFRTLSSVLEFLAYEF